MDEVYNSASKSGTARLLEKLLFWSFTILALIGTEGKMFKPMAAETEVGFAWVY